jgi:ABC-type phosphate/phosphonate transport system substrate-binding protein
MIFLSLGVRCRLLALAFICLTAFLPNANAADRVAQGDLVRIGMIGSLFRDVPPGTVMVMMQPFGMLMKSQTGVNGEIIPGGDVGQLGQQLSDNKLQLAVFHGFEFAWARLKHPELRPLVVAINEQYHLHAQLVVAADSPAACLHDLEGKTLALPHQTREHCFLYLQRRCLDCKKPPESLFSKITNPPNVEDALDDVVDGVVQVAVVDGVALDCYKRRKPGRFVRLKVVERSEPFPAAVIAYRPGVLDEATLNRFRDGMINANKNPLGKQLLTLWKLTGFEPIPADYEQTLAATAKAYPPEPGTLK